jgi:hypothetical protein
MFYKEWIKTRWFWILALLATNGFAGYCMLRIHRMIELRGAEHLWEIMLQRDAIFINLLTYIPLLVGTLLAIVQYVPEMHHKCLKLTLHLPVSALKTISVMLLSGIILLLVCFALNFLLMWSFLHPILAHELVWHILLTAIPWYLAGMAAYLLVSWICLEPSWKRRVLNLIVAVLTLKIFFIEDTPEAYNAFLPLLTLFTLLTASLVWLSVARFKEGKQD